MFSFYQHIPQYLDPIVFSIGSFAIRWYSLMYVAGILTAFFLLHWRIGKGEAPQDFKISNSKTEKSGELGITLDILLVGFWGMLFGGRLGYILFYNFPYYLQNPVEALLPVAVSGDGLRITGYYGMSYHGALLGVIASGCIFLKIRKLDFWRVADFVAPAAAGAYFFGRIGNFLNGELWGRETNSFLGMYFGEDFFLRHPSQLYEAFLEGLVLFLLLWIIRNKGRFDGQVFLVYIVGYAFFRYVSEYFRSPDWQSGLILGIFSTGQLLSLCMLAGGSLLYFQKNRKNAII